MGTRRTPAKRASKRPTPARVGAGLWLRAPILQQRELDLLGLGLVALGVFLAFVFYLGWNGGTLGGGLAEGLRYLVGTIAYGVPVALAGAGAVVVLRPFLPASRPFGSGLVCLFAALTLAFAAGTAGLGPGGARTDVWARAFVAPRGGVVGEALYSAATPAVQTLGAHMLAVFLFIAGMLLLTGATVAGVVHALRTGAVGTGRRLRDSTAELQAAVARRSAAAAPFERLPASPEPVAPPEPADHDLVVRATHVEAPPLDAAARFPELFGRRAPDHDRAGSSDEDAATERNAAAANPEPDPEPDPEEPGVTKVGGPPADPKDLTPQGRYRETVTDDPAFQWRVPDSKLLTRSSAETAKPDTSGQERTAAALLEALGHFGVQARVVGTVAGPHITRYELRLAPGTKVSKVAQLKDDLAYALAATDIRILAPIPGKQAVGVEVPNARRRIVHLGDVFQHPPEDWSPLTVWLGKDVAGRAIGADLAKMPHLLVAGTTGAGKSGAVNAMLASILLRATPHEVRLVLVDPKQVELNHYDSIPHLLTPVITAPRMAANALQNLVREMESRYGEMSLARTRSLIELNRARAKRNEPALPYILCVIDELADLMMVAPADVEDSIIRLAQKARAVGIHLVLATQSPRVDVITGMIKANVPSRIAFAVSSQTDSRVILDQNGAESLLGQGDMLFSPVGTSRLQRIQGAYVDEEQIAELTEYWCRQGEPDFHEALLEEVEAEEGSGSGGDDDFDPDEDPLLEEAIALVAQMGTASTSMLQRRLRLGYTRAGRLIDMLERRGVISGYEGSKPRQVLIGEADVPRMLSGAGGGVGAEMPEPVSAEPEER
ncbi:MAG: DNA translocase FtsK [Actinomycetota bacterium]|nr:DNA translocase FtsK [Actinomycetota bacterium]